MRRYLSRVIALPIALVLAQLAPAAVFQYALPVKAGAKTTEAFLWIPPEAKQIRGVAIGGMTLIERELVQDPAVREACADQSLALIFLRSGLKSVDVQQVLDDFAKVSGYRELSVAPLFFVGHSAGGPQAKDLAIQYADRCFGLMQYRGGHPHIGPPGGAEPVPPGIPSLMMLGQFDEFARVWRNSEGKEAWEFGRDSMAAYRKADKRNLGTIVAEPGAGHFPWSDRNAAYFAMFLRKAAQARIPESWPIDAKKPVMLKTVLPESGWLTDLTIRPAGKFAPAPYADYQGDKTYTNWHFDRDLAEATIAYHRDLPKKDQFLRWQDKVTLDADVRPFFDAFHWVGDGQTFEVHPEYRTTYPGNKSKGEPKWADAGKPAGHSSAPVEVRRVSGSIVGAGPNRFRMRYEALAPAGEAARITFLAFSPGDKDYRHTELVGMSPKGFGGIASGKDQKITFPALPNAKVGGDPIPLKATSDSGLPVEYYVAQGPAIVNQGKLIITDVPARAAFPIPIRVVAYQFGRGLEPIVKTATPVEQTIMLEEPRTK